MTSPHGRYVISYNGEIYNFRELRMSLIQAGFQFRSDCDTEVVLAGFEAWGIRPTIEKLLGMFALAVWDEEEDRLHLVRDRLGIKPLYYASVSKMLFFASELGALEHHPRFGREIDRAALTSYLRFLYVPDTMSIYKSASKVAPGSIMTFDVAESIEGSERPYWRATELHEFPPAADDPAPEREQAVERLDSLLRDSVRRRLVSDVPLGALLSGGTDSSLVTALMQEAVGEPIKTFSVGFSELGFDESEHARAVASHLGTEHHELQMSAGDALAVIDLLPDIYDEPFADSSQIPTYLVARLARQHVTVALSGDGGDELHGGYDRYFVGERLWRLNRLVPETVSRGISWASSVAGASIFGKLAGAAGRWKSSSTPGRLRRQRLQTLIRLLQVHDRPDFIREMTSLWLDPERVVVDGYETARSGSDVGYQHGSLQEQMMLNDICMYLPGDILTKVDRASMAVSLEVRVPLLDHRLVEFATRIPAKERIDSSVRKPMLKAILSQYLPQHLIHRPKRGFSIPLAQWLRGPLRDWGDELLDPVDMRQQGYFRPEPIRRLWKEHQSRRANWEHQLWAVLMFRCWCERRNL